MTTMTQTKADSFVRTAAGRAEIREHRLPLSRSARNLLMVIDASCTGVEWIGRVHGSSLNDLAQLVAMSLVDFASPAGARTVQRPVALEEAVRDWSYDALYTLLTHEARERFGLIKGYRLILKIEGCTNQAGMQDVALEFAAQLRKAHGEEVAARFRRQLGATE